MAYIAAKRQLTEEYTLTAGTAFAMRMPTLSEFYEDEPFTPVARFGNSYVEGLSTLLPEKNLQLDLGIAYEKENLRLALRGFYANVWDYILPVPAYIDPCAPDFIVAPRVLGRDFRDFPSEWRMDLGTPNENSDTCNAGYQYVNLDLVTLFGGDLSGEADLREGLSVFGSMSYVCGMNLSRVVFLANDSSYSPDGQIIPLNGSEGLPGMYPLNGTLGVRLSEPAEDRWLLEFSSRLVAAQDYVAVSLSEIRNPGFVTFDLRGYYRIRKNVRLSLSLENLLNTDYSEPGSLAFVDRWGQVTFIKEPGFTALLGVDASF